ncbi:MAG: outer membrane beta-barrel protein [Planctomycetota bacterium]|nr:outer membrane beta-barrel protein [Planctomycetota bacterium]
MTVDRFGKVLLLSAGLAVVCSSAVRAESTSAEEMKQVLARMRAMEEKMASQEKEIGNLKGKLKQAEAYSAAKPDIHMQINKAIASKTASDKIFHDPEIFDRAIKFGGSLDIQYQYSFNTPHTHNGTNPNSPDFRTFGGGNFNSFQVSQVDFFLDGTAQEKGQAGFRIDWNLGRDPVNAGYTFTSLNSGAGTVNTGLEQAYIDYIADIGNGVHFRLGKFVTPFGFEVIEGADNWNVTRAFNFERAIPFTHTGLSVDYKWFDNFTTTGFIVNDLFQGDPGLDANSGKAFMFQTNWAPSKWVTWIVNVGASQDDNRSTDVDSGSTRYKGDWLYLVNSNVTFTPWEKFAFAVDATYGNRQNGESRYNVSTFNNTGRVTYDDGVFYGIAGYVKYDFLKNWYVAGRYEYFWDLDGATGGPTGDPATDNINPSAKMWSATATVDWALSNPLHVRFEFRHDEVEKVGGHIAPGYRTSSGAGPNGTPFRNTNDTFTMSWVLKF